MLPVPIPIEDFGRQTSEFATEVGSLKSEVEESDGVPAVTRPAGGILPRPSATPSILEGEFAPNSSPKIGEVPRSGGGVCPPPKEPAGGILHRPSATPSILEGELTPFAELDNASCTLGDPHSRGPAEQQRRKPLPLSRRPG